MPLGFIMGLYLISQPEKKAKKVDGGWSAFHYYGALFCCTFIRSWHITNWDKSVKLGKG
jgi:hypothetical protein